MRKMLRFAVVVSIIACIVCCGAVNNDALTEVIGTAPFDKNIREENNKCGENLTWEFDEANRTLKIIGNGNMSDFSYD